MRNNYSKTPMQNAESMYKMSALHHQHIICSCETYILSIDDSKPTLSTTAEHPRFDMFSIKHLVGGSDHSTDVSLA